MKPLPAIAGKVVARGEPARAASVILRWRVHPELPGLVGHTLGDRGLGERRQLVDARGRFRFEPPHRGPFLLLAVSGKRSSLQEFPVMAGDRFVLRLEDSHEIGGSVVGPDGKPLAGKRVRLLPEAQAWPRLAFYRLPERRAETTTDADGRFRLFFEHGYLRAPRWGAFAFAWVDGTTHSNPRPVVVRPDGASRRLLLSLTAPQRVQGTVVDARSGKPIPGATVFESLARRTVRTDEQGRYSFVLPTGSAWVLAPSHAPIEVQAVLNPGKAVASKTSLPKGLRLRARLLVAENEPLANARVLFAAPGASHLPAEWVERTAADGSIETSSIPRGRPCLAFVEHDGVFVRFHAGNLRLGLDLGKVLLGKERTLHGRVRTAGGELARGAQVALMPRDRLYVMPFRVTYTDRMGRFHFDAVPRGEHSIVAATAADGQAAIEVPARWRHEPLRIQIPTGKTIQGQVLDPNREPVPGAWVTIWKSRMGNEIPGPTAGWTAHCTLTGSDGRFRFTGLSEAGSWQLISKYLRHGAYWRGSASASPGSTITLSSEVVRQ